MTALSLAVLALCAAPGDAVLVQFSSQQCPHCKAMEPILNRLAAEGCPVQVIDVDQQPDVRQQFKVTGVPTFVALAAGRETGRIVGATSYEKLTTLYRGAQGGEQVTGGEHEASGSQFVALGGGASAASAAPAATGGSPEQTAMAATVRLKVEDGSGFGFGTGTIIDTHDNEALVVTCGHLFRESKGQGKITADVFAAGSPQTLEGQLIAYDLDRDVALVSFRVPFAVQAARIAPPARSVRPGEQVFTIGCDKGADPTVRRSHITAVNKYIGRPNYTAAGQPVDGRSGGGLFTADGLLIGICNAADAADDEGLYAGLASIHWQLDQIGQSEIYQRGAAGQVAAAATPEATTEAAVPQLASAMPDAAAVQPASYSATSANVPSNPLPSDAAPLDYGPIAEVGDDTEIVFIVRSKRDPQRQSEVFVVDQAAPDLVARITQAARTSGQHRAAAIAQNRGAAPVVRGQSEP